MTAHPTGQHLTTNADGVAEPWRDPGLPVPERVRDLLGRMTLPEKLAQLSSVWLSSPDDGDGQAPLQGEFTGELPPLPELIRHGLGQLTRVFGTRPVTPAAGMRTLAELQAQVTAASRFGIPLRDRKEEVELGRHVDRVEGANLRR